MKTGKGVKVIIPLYKETLSEIEHRLVLHNLKVLANHPIVFLLPEDLATDRLTEEFAIPLDRHETIRVSTDWLGRKNGIAGYNRMMLSEAFYALFEGCEYILICQSDVYIFRDELDSWCERGYDYVGAPWTKREMYNNPLIHSYLKLRKTLHRREAGFLRQDLFNRVGNGGLSLRHVEHFRAACLKYRDRIDQMVYAPRNHLSNEDVFWAIVPEGFRYPEVREAIRFSIDVHPELGLKMIDGAMPFGCHGLTRSHLYRFWRDKLSLD